MNDGTRPDALIPAHLMAGVGLVALVLFAGFSLALKPVTIRVWPNVANGPVDLHLELHVPRDPANRVVQVNTDGGSFARSSAWELEGERAPAIFTVWWRAIPPGDYEITARLFGVADLRGADSTWVTVR